MNQDHPTFWNGPLAAGPNGRELAVVGRYVWRSEAYDRALVVLAMEIPHWIMTTGDEFQLCVEPTNAMAAMKELEKFERERELAPPPPVPEEKTSSTSLLVAAAILGLFFAAQNAAPSAWEDEGASASDAVMRGQWWRVLTALTLHADFSHFGANLAAGLVLAAFLLPMLGTGWTWLGIVLTGALGNWLNAWGHRGEMHRSIGASTAVFGALGLLVGAQIAGRALLLRRLTPRELLVPIGTGLALLAYLGVGDAQTDFTAHLCGLCVGIPLGAIAIAGNFKIRTPPAAQLALAFAAPLLLLLAWALALVAESVFPR